MSKILVVEDEEAIADLEKDYLELAGFDVEIANNGNLGLKKALEEELGTDVDMDTFWDDVNEGKYDNLYDESLEGDDTYSDYIEGVYHWDSDDCNHMTMS